MSYEPWGFSLLLNASGCDHDALTSSEIITKFVKQLVEEIDMVAYGEPQIVNFGTGNKAGYTLVQLIETSNICAHFVNSLDEIYLDVFSCKPFSQEHVIEVFKEYFKPTDYTCEVLPRKAPR